MNSDLSPNILRQACPAIRGASANGARCVRRRCVRAAHARGPLARVLRGVARGRSERASERTAQSESGAHARATRGVHESLRRRHRVERRAAATFGVDHAKASKLRSRLRALKPSRERSCLSRSPLRRLPLAWITRKRASCEAGCERSIWPALKPRQPPKRLRTSPRKRTICPCSTGVDAFSTSLAQKSRKRIAPSSVRLGI